MDRKIRDGQKIRVLSCYLSNGKNIGNTDHEYMENFSGLEKINKNVNVRLNRSVLSGLIQRAGFYMKRMGDKIGVELEIRKALHWKILIFPWTTWKANVAISRVFFPTRLFNNIPLVYHSGFPPNRYVGASNLEERRENARKAARFYQENTEATIFSTQEAVNRFRRIVPEELGDKIVYLPYFLPNVEPVESDHVDRTFADSDRLQILFVGEDGKRKGVYQFLEAIEIATDRYPDLRRRVKVTVVSRTDIGEHNFPIDHHRFLPHEQVLDKFRNAHVFCLPTQRDVYGLVFIEAMASGCAIIADDSPVRQEILDEGKAGLLSNPSDPEDIADRLVTLLHSPSQAKALAKRALRRFRSHYYWKPVGKKYVDLLKKAAFSQ